MSERVAAFSQCGVSADTLTWLKNLRTYLFIFLSLAMGPLIWLELLVSNTNTYLILLGLFISTHLIQFNLQNHPSLKWPHLIPLWHLLIDLFFLTAFLSLGGGAWSPLSLLLFLYIPLAVFLLKPLYQKFFMLSFAIVLLFLSGPHRLPALLSASPMPRFYLLPAQLLFAILLWRFSFAVVTQLQKTEKRKNELEQSQTRLNHFRAIGALVASVAHKIGTPLNTLQMRLERLGKSSLTDEQKNEWHALMQVCQQCLDVHRLLLDERMSQQVTQFEKIDLKDLLSDIQKIWQEEGSQVSLVIDHPHKENLNINAPLTLLTNAILDLLDNALEAQNNHPHPIQLKVAKDPAGQNVELQILDRGHGVAPVILDNFGEAFLSTKHNGSGLGLHNARLVAETLRGSLSIGNRKKGGAWVKLSLPLIREEGA